MTAQLLPAPKWRLTKNDGTPAANYVVYTYTTGGAVTAKPTYTTADQAVSNGAIVTLNARGEADIWWDGLYYIAVYKSAVDGGGLLFAMDNYGVVGSGALVFPNRIGNGSFEDGVDAAGHPNGWDVTTYTGSTFSVDDTDSAHGGSSAKGISIGNGGAQLITEDFTPCDESMTLNWRFFLKSTVADVRNLVEIVWYDADQALLSATSIYDDSATNPTSWTAYQGITTPVASARYLKIRVTLCHASDATAGTSRIDGIDIDINKISGLNNTFTGDNISSGLESFAKTKFSVPHGPNYLNNISIDATVAANALTATLYGNDGAAPSAANPVQLSFRNSALTTGTTTVATATAATSVTAPDGATLGFIASEDSYVYAYALNFAGAVELILSGSPSWDTNILQSTTAISNAADSKSVLYSTTARTNVAIRFLGIIKIATGATPGQWGTAATIKATATDAPPVLSLGYCQTWQTVTGSRSVSTTYTNSTGRPISIAVIAAHNNTLSALNLIIDGITMQSVNNSNSGLSQIMSMYGIVPVGGTYSVTGQGLSLWHELR